MTIVRTTIDGNTATQAGGGMAVSNQQDGNDVTVRDTTVSNNRVEQETQVPRGAPGRSQRHRRRHRLRRGVRGRRAGQQLDRLRQLRGRGGGIHAGSPVPLLPGRARLDGSPSLSRLLEKAEQEAPAEVPEHRGTTTTPAPPPPPTGSLVVSNTTVASNDADDTGGGVSVDPSATDQASTKLSSTIVGNNNAGGAANDLATSGEEGLDVGYSLIENAGSAAVTPIARPAERERPGPRPGRPDRQRRAHADPPPGGLEPGDRRGHRERAGHRPARAAPHPGPPAGQRADGTDIGAVEIPGETPVTPSRPVTPSSTPTICGRRAISLVRADIKGKKVKLTGLVGSKFYGKTVTIQTDPKGAKNSAFTKTGTVKASSTGSFTSRCPSPDKDDIASSATARSSARPSRRR